jgi:putative DNA primase/helicase
MNAPFDPHAIAAEAVAEASTPTPPKEIPRPITSAALLGMDIPPRRMLLAPYLPEAGAAMLYAPRGIGKTWVSLSLAYAVAAGGAVLNGHASEPRRVLYIDGEMPLVTLQERLGAVALGMGRNLPEDDFLQFLPADHYRDGLPDLASPEGRELVEELAEGVALVVFDNLSSLARYKENEADSWQPIQDLVLSLRRRGATSLLVHHAGKSGQQRGTSRREDVLDTVIALRRPEEYEATQGARFHWHYEKARGFMGDDAAPFEATLTLDEGAARWQVTALVKTRQALATDMLAAGASVAEIVTATGASRATVYRWKQEMEGRSDGVH